MRADSALTHHAMPHLKSHRHLRQSPEELAWEGLGQLAGFKGVRCCGLAEVRCAYCQLALGSSRRLASITSTSASRPRIVCGKALADMHTPKACGNLVWQNRNTHNVNPLEECSGCSPVASEWPSLPSAARGFCMQGLDHRAGSESVCCSDLPGIPDAKCPLAWWKIIPHICRSFPSVSRSRFLHDGSGQHVGSKGVRCSKIKTASDSWCQLAERMFTVPHNHTSSYL